MEGLDVFVGPERLIHQGIEAGARGAVSALATAFPELVSEALREPSAVSSARAGAVRDAREGFPRHAALERVLALRGVPVREDVRGAAPPARRRGAPPPRRAPPARLG